MIKWALESRRFCWPSKRPDRMRICRVDLLGLLLGLLLIDLLNDGNSNCMVNSVDLDLDVISHYTLGEYSVGGNLWGKQYSVVIQVIILVFLL